MLHSYQKPLVGNVGVVFGCGKQSPGVSRPEDALDKATAADWFHINKTDEDYCPECLENKICSK